MVAEVNGESITLDDVQWELQLPYLIPRTKSDNTIIAALNRVIERRLLAQKALSLDLDKIARVQTALLASREDILARSYVESKSRSFEQPSSQDIFKYYLEHPSLFGDRKIFSIREYAIGATPDKADEFRERLMRSRSIESFATSLRISGLSVIPSQAIRPAEQIPLYMLADVAALTPGVPSIYVAPDGSVSALIVDASRLEPMGISAASPIIAQFLINEKRREFIGREVDSLKLRSNINIYDRELK